MHILNFYFFFYFFLSCFKAVASGRKKNYSNQFWDVISALVTTLLSAGGWLEMAVTVAVVVATKVRERENC